MTTTYIDCAASFDTGTAEEGVTTALADGVAGVSPVRAGQHPLGFSCRPLLREGGWGICVHVWDGSRDTAAPTTSEVHCHSWALRSRVLFGRVGNQRARAQDSGARTGHVLFLVGSERRA